MKEKLLKLAEQLRLLSVKETEVRNTKIANIITAAVGLELLKKQLGR